MGEYSTKAKSNIVIGIEKSGSKPKKTKAKEENIESIKCSPCAKLLFPLIQKLNSSQLQLMHKSNPSLIQ